ncbi:MAG: hypothetical protein N838_23440 [Thiohalocapsa sp. PB-PSB1]|nr:MAG: hypothetical protein N838_23440 [Thiohalocapsa sp. PB-PSB1]
MPYPHVCDLARTNQFRQQHCFDIHVEVVVQKGACVPLIGAQPDIVNHVLSTIVKGHRAP